jgi:penicillin-binding protein 1A
MKRVLANKPVQVFTVPEGIVFAKIDAATGRLAGPATQNVLFECFKEGTLPTDTSAHSDGGNEPEDLSKTEY